MSKFNAIVAVSIDGYISVDGQLPWNSKKELAYFKKMTQGRIVIMGRKTWESLPKSVRPLPGRRNIVLTRDKNYVAEGAEVFHDVNNVCREVYGGNKDAYVIGGAELFLQFRHHIDFFSITRVGLCVDGDTRFQFDFDEREWSFVERGDLSFEEDDIDFDIIHAYRGTELFTRATSEYVELEMSLYAVES